MRSRIINCFSAACAFYFVSSSTGLCQTKYGEMSLTGPEELTMVVRAEDQAVLSIVSEVPELEFESTRRIFEIRPISLSEWQLFVEPGRQIVTIRAKGYLPLKTAVINLTARRAYGVKVTQVKPAPGTLYVISTPDSAGLRINGMLIESMTPYSQDVDPGVYNVEVIKKGYRTEMKSLTVEPNQVTEWEAALVQTAVRVKINVIQQIQDVGIMIDDAAMGLTPTELYLEPGSYRLVLQKEGYKRKEKVIEITPGQKEIIIVEKLQSLSKPMYSKWWFWAGSATFAGSAVFLLSGGGGPAAPAPKPLPEAPEFP